MKSTDWKSILQKHPVFSALSEPEIERLLDRKVSREKRFREGATILREGEPGESIFLIGSGQVNVVLLGKDDQQVLLTTLKAGEFFGEMALFERRPRSATAIAAGKCVLLEVEGDEFLKLIEAHPEIEVKVTAQVSARLRRVGQQIIKLQRDLSERVEILNTKLDAELRVTDATLKATQTVFDQTNKRANEIIESADRSRTRLTVAASAVGTIVAAVVAVLGFLGISEVQNLNKQVKNAQTLAGEIKDIKRDIEKAQTTVTNMIQEVGGKAKLVEETVIRLDSDARRIRRLQLLVDRVNKEYMQTVMRRFSDELKKEELDITSIDKDYKLILATNDREVTDKAFRLIYGAILESNEKFKLSIMLDGGIKEYAKTSEQRILSYYLSLVALILDGKFEEYKKTFDAFRKEVASYKDVPLKQVFKSKFDPKNFDEYLDYEGSDGHKEIKKTLIKNVWANIPG